MSLSPWASTSSGSISKASSTRSAFTTTPLDLIPKEPGSADQRQGDPEVTEEMRGLHGERMGMALGGALLARQLVLGAKLQGKEAGGRDVADHALLLQLEACADEPQHQADDRHAEKA